ncbi:glutamyl endopeptidase [Micromonospora phaseoli]|uniref:Serine protease n=1 Tax=Micromonospora phaseoli TaxID=1144548 RepID=A0A1H7CNL5_9ACTN|nr:trypsin-like serine protease [Micromonospora phaseoli]PZV91655.1 glutamyl endopeptidase [Micromonospora phaseoli]GIJ79286.1 extracellular metalloprotease [Micromonospora phaseoli]SEJ91229.1 glutamyl endopeptidase [Micromonospora phaseoli]
MAPTPPISTRLRIMFVVGLTTALVSTAAAPATAAPATDARAGGHGAVADSGAVPASVAPTALSATSDAKGAGSLGRAGTGRAGPGGTRFDVGGRALAPDAEPSVGIQSVIGTDNRVRVDPTTVFPARAIVQVVRTTGGSTWGCTGWLYGPSIVATAGHCVHPGGGANGGGGNGFYPRGDFQIIPGRNGASTPYGTCTATQLLSVTGWTQSGNETNDYGAIRLNCTAGNTTGWFGLWWQSATLNGTATTVSGYPCDKTFGQQWRHAGQTVQATHAQQVFYQNDTFGCQSGSPVYQTRATGSSFCSGQCVMAIHAYGLHGSAPHSTNNHGTRITESVFNNLITWRDS